MRILVVGCGSIGERHIRNLRGLSVDRIMAHDVNGERLSLMKEKYNVQACSDLKEAFSREPNAVLVCTPPNLHVSIALDAIEHGAHVFVEKPISHNLERVNDLIEKAKEKDLVVLVGYNLRYHPGLNFVRKMLYGGEIGRILSVRVEAGQYLPDWRPWQDYRQSYTAKIEQGGGVILDGSHELDYVRWLLGDVKEVSCLADKISSLEVETEDTAEILLRFKSGIIAGVHLDFVQRAYSRSCKLIGEEGTIIWNYPENFVKIYTAKTKMFRTFNIDFETNDMYVYEMRHFMKCILGEDNPLVDGSEGKKTLELALAAKKSAETGKVVVL